jgi:hypothetical protein
MDLPMSSSIDIIEPLEEICRRLGIERKKVNSMLIDPTTVIVRILEVGKDGRPVDKQGRLRFRAEMFNVWTSRTPGEDEPCQ